MIKIALLYLAAAVIFFAIDMLWLGLVAHKFYQTHLGFLLAEKVNWVAAMIFYAVYLAGVLYFAIIPALERESFTHALLSGAFLGFLCYATYDLTNLATLHKWPVTVVWVDIAWGTFLTGAVASLTYLAGSKWLNF